MNLHDDTKIQSFPVQNFKKAFSPHREKMMWIIFISSLNFSQVSTQRHLTEGDDDGAGEDGELKPCSLI